MHTTKPTQWPLWIRLLLPVLTLVLKSVGTVADARDRRRDQRQAMATIDLRDSDYFADVWARQRHHLNY